MNRRPSVDPSAYADGTDLNSPHSHCFDHHVLTATLALQFSIHDLLFTSLSAPNIETIVSLAKRRGFVYPSSEIYGGLGSAWDYGPMGIELYNNVKQAWWRWMVYERDDIEGLDSSIILNRKVWKYSGHEDTFSDPLVDCRECNSRFRADKLEQEWAQEETAKSADGIQVIAIPIGSALRSGKVKCANCGKANWTDTRPFNLMFRT